MTCTMSYRFVKARHQVLKNHEPQLYWYAEQRRLWYGIGLSFYQLALLPALSNDRGWKRLVPVIWDFSSFQRFEPGLCLVISFCGPCWLDWISCGSWIMQQDLPVMNDLIRWVRSLFLKCETYLTRLLFRNHDGRRNELCIGFGCRVAALSRAFVEPAGRIEGSG